MRSRLAAILLAALMGCTVFPAGGGGGGGKPSVPPPPGPPWLSQVKIPAHLRRPPRQEEILIGGDLTELLAGDFAVYPLASRRLLARGEIVVPYLGFAAENRILAPGDGEEEPQADARRISIALKQLLMEIPAEHIVHCFGSPYVAVRVGGAAAAGERHLTELASELVDLLDDPRLEVRHASVTALRRISNEFFGYRPDASASRRKRAVARWRALWASPGTRG